MTAVVEFVYRLLERGGAGAGPSPIVGSVNWRGREGRHKAGTYRELMGLAGRGLAKLFRMGTCHQCRHQVDEACCRTGGVAGAEPPHKGGRLRPTAQKARREKRSEERELPFPLTQS